MHAIISDVHGNLEALKTVLSDIRKRHIEDIIFLGDAIGYGPDPLSTLRLLRDNSSLMIRGNHDQAILTPGLLDSFNEYARKALQWTASNLDEGSLEIIKGMPLTAEKNLYGIDIFFVHGSPREPERWHYILTLSDVEINLHYFDGDICFVGHTHQPFIVEKKKTGEIIVHRKGEMVIDAQSRYIINAGSVGQPRDMDPRACYVILDNERISFVRVSYDIKKTQKKMKEAGLPLYLIDRLERGA